MSNEPRTERRLAAILAADVVGYSRLMETDEEGTLSALREHRRELIDPLIEQHDGRVVKTTGDGLLIEFASIVDAVRCAVIIGQGMEDRNANVDADRQIQFRCGINVGDVIVEDGDIFGDGVNVAARLEALAKPGEIYVSGTVREHVGEKLPVRFADMGQHTVKNIARPIHVFRIDPGPGDESAPAPAPPSRAVGVNKPSIAVLPFDNMSGDPEQDYFADGMVEDIITGLSRFDQFLVIARNTMFTFKGRAVDVRHVAGELNVRYVLEGSVRRAGNRVRITGQLIDADTGGHVWADRFDGEMEDVFDLQDRITTAVVGVLEPSIRKAELEKIKRHRPEDMGVYDLYIQALSLMVTNFRQADHAPGFALLKKALELDPNYVPALALSAWCLEFGHTRNWPPLTDDDKALAISQGKAVLVSGTNDENALAVAGFAVQTLSRDYQLGADAAHRALRLNPNSAIVQLFAGLSLVFGGEAGTARACFERALQLSPADPGLGTIYAGIGLSHFSEGGYEEAVDVSRRSIMAAPDRETPYWGMVAASAMLDRMDDAKDAFDQLRRLNPHAESLEYWERLPFRDSPVKTRFLDSVRQVIERG